MSILSTILSRLTMDEVVRVVYNSSVDGPSASPLDKPLRVEGPVTLMSVPFTHRLRILPDGWRVREWTYQPTLVPVLLGATPGIATSALIAYDAWLDGILTSSVEHMLGAVFFLALGLLCLAMGVVWLGRYRRLYCDRTSGLFQVSYGNLLTRAHIEVTVPFSDALLSLHEIHAFPTRAMMKDRRFGWTGWGLALHLDRDVFLLGCHRQREHLLGFASDAPSPLKEMAVVEGPRIEGLAYR